MLIEFLPFGKQLAWSLLFFPQCIAVQHLACVDVTGRQQQNGEHYYLFNAAEQWKNMHMN